jgi:hypothetical protein
MPLKTTAVMFRAALVSLAALTLNACVGMMNGRVDTASYQTGSLTGTFTVIPPDALSLTDKAISEMIAERMLEQGFERPADGSAPDVAVLFAYAIGGASVWSQPDFARGGHSVYSTRPRSFQVVLADVAKSVEQEELSILWQGETYSSGTISDIRRVAPYFLDAIFENFGETVSDKRWMRPVTDF